MVVEHGWQACFHRRYVWMPGVCRGKSGLERSHPALETKMLLRGEINATHIANRRILRDSMTANGWQGIATEWWHFDCGDRLLVRQNYTRIL